MLNAVRCFYRDQNGATAIEYSLIAALVSVTAIGSLSSAGDSLGSLFETVSTTIDKAGSN